MTIHITKPCSAHRSDGTFLVGMPVGTPVEMIGRDGGGKLLVLYLGRQFLVKEAATDYRAEPVEMKALQI